jgi:aquaporin TIP
MPMSGDYIRRAAAEFVGTFALIFIGAGSVIFARTLTDVALAHGLVIAVMVSAVGFISGGHFNPAVTLGMVVTRRIAIPLAVVYWITQLLAATAAAGLLGWLLPTSITGATWNNGTPTVATGLAAGHAVIIEAVLTFFLVWVVFATAVDDRGAFKQIAGLAIGFTIAFDILLAGVLTGGAMNPARAFGPELVSGDWTNWWVWVLGPLSGGAVAAVLYELLFLRSDAEAPGSTAVDEPAVNLAAADALPADGSPTE